MCIRFNKRLSNNFAKAVNLAGGKFRRIGNGQKGWLVHPDDWEGMQDLMDRHELFECADEVRRFIDTYTAIKTVVILQ